MNLALLLLLQTAPSAIPQTDLPPIDFQRQIRPILAKNCLACHGGDPSTREAEMRLDLREEAIKLRDDEYAVIVPGDADASEMIFRVGNTLDPMPPESTGRHLTGEQIELLRRWIDEGAEYTPHWAFIKPNREVPKPGLHLVKPGVLSHGGAPKGHPIDGLVRAELKKNDLLPAERADRRTLIRRLSFDLIGLPPTPEELQDFLKDQNPRATENLIDRLLASPKFGERWAAVWLDLARYADSKGHGSDPLRTIWRYRDWVIDALNADMPFDEFTMQQMAGDLLPNATMENQLATAFHRNSLVNTEGGTDDEEFRVAAIKERSNLTMQVWMGLTFGCAECHTHKFDPITHEDYYSTFAIFNQTADTDKNDDSPKISTPTAHQQKKLLALNSEVRRLKQQMNSVPVDSTAFEAWQAKALKAQNSWQDWPQAAKSDSLHFLSSSKLNYQFQSDKSWLINGVGTDSDRLRFPFEVRGQQPTGIRLQALADPSLPGGGPGLSPGNGNFVISESAVHWTPSQDNIHQTRFVRLSLAGDQRILSLAEIEIIVGGNNIAIHGVATQSSTAYDGVASRAIDGITDGDYFSAESVTHNQRESNPWWEVELQENFQIDEIRIWNRTDGNLQNRLNGLKVDLLDEDRQLIHSNWIVTAPLEYSSWRPAQGGKVKIQSAVASFAQDGFTASMAIDGNLETGWAIGPRQGQDHELHLQFQLPTGPGTLMLDLHQGFGNSHLLGKFRAQWTDRGTPPPLLPPDIASSLRQPQSQRSESSLALLEDHYRSFDPGIQSLRKKLADAEAKIKGLKIPQTPVLVALAPENHRRSYVLEKGNFLNPLQEVKAAVPAAFDWGAESVNNRAELATWLTHPDNPLTARVQANRIWARLFGRGIVSTEEDFGAQGALPTHPELLDWLALEYASHWSLKRFLKTVVMSATYQQSSVTTAEHLQLDPQNVLLSRGPRFRLTAEMVRDQALQVSGLLSSKMHGPSVFPPQPDGLWQAAFNGERTWQTSEGEDRYRRALYTFLRRSTPYPSMVVFDAPSREICTIRRIRTNTPLQAFVTLNDPVYVECAQALGRRILREAGPSSKERLAYAYELCLGRPADEPTLKVLQELLKEQISHYSSRPEEAKQLATSPLGPLPMNNGPGGSSKPDDFAKSGHPPGAADLTKYAEYAGWTVLANVLLNLDSFLNKD